MLIILFLVLFFGLLAIGMPIFLVLGLCAAVLYLASGEPLIGVAQVIIDHLNSSTLMSLPLFVMAATFTLVVGLVMQAVTLSAYLLLRQPSAMTAILKSWKPSLFAGLMGALASQFWFLAFALTAAANVRTLALVEVLFAQGVAYYSFKQPLSARELFGIALIVAGVALLVAV